MEEDRDPPEEVDVQVESNLLYSLEGSPNPFLWPVFALQQILVFIGGVISVSTLMTIQLGARDQPEVRAQILSISLVGCGIGTTLQCVIGSRLPMIFGSVATLIPAIAAILGPERFSDENLWEEIRRNNETLANEPWKIRMREIQGNLMLAAATQMLMGVTGMIGFLLRFIGPLTIAPTITVTGFYIGKFVMPLCEEHWGIAVLSMTLLTSFVLFLKNVHVPIPTCSRKGLGVSRIPLFALTSLLLSICIAWLFSYILTITDVLPSNATLHGHMARTDVRVGAMSNTPWFIAPIPFQFGLPSVGLAGYLGMMSTIFAGVIKCTGDYILAARIAEVVPPPAHAVNRGIAVYGLSLTLSAMIGDICIPSPYSQNIGAITITKVASRKVFVTAGVLMILAGIVGKIGAVFIVIPDPIIGGVTLVVMGLVASAGIAALQDVQLASSRNLMIIGLTMIVGILVPDWMNLHPNAVKSGSDEFDQIATVLLSNPMFLAGFIGCFLDNVVPGTERERGIKARREILETSSSKSLAGEDTYELPYITNVLKKLTLCSYFPVSPTYESSRNCTPCCAKTNKKSSYSIDNAAYVEEGV